MGIIELLLWVLQIGLGLGLIFLVLVLPATVYWLASGGGLPEDVVVGTRVEIEGSLAGGVLTARGVKFDALVTLQEVLGSR